MSKIKTKELDKDSKKLYIVYGGPSSERKVSIASKDYFYNLYKDQNPILVEWLEDFRFKVQSQPLAGLGSQVFSENNFYEKLSKEKCIVIIAGHGEYIEDGYLQEKLALNKIAFTGSSSSSCRLAMDKYESQLIANKYVSTIPTYKCKPKDFDFSLFEKHVGTFPVFAKPNNLGSSVGCFKVSSKTGLKRLLAKLSDIEYLFQPSISGIELTVGSVRYNNKFLKIPVTEIRPKVSDFFTWEAKYSKGGSDEITPATVNKKIQRGITEIANKIHNALGLGFYSRSDFILKGNNLYYLETNPYPGMSGASLLPQQLDISNNKFRFAKGLVKNLQ